MTQGEDDETKVMTYAEFAVARGITLTSARRMAIRYKWRKTRGNDGFTRISIPLSAIPPAPLAPEIGAGENGDPQTVLIEWLIESSRRADERAERAEARAGAAEAQVAEMREQYIAELREMRDWQLRLLAQMQPWWRTVLGRSRRPTPPPVGQLLGSSVR